MLNLCTFLPGGSADRLNSFYLLFQMLYPQVQSEFEMIFLGAMTTMCLNSISSHLMQHFLDQPGHHQLEMGFNTLTVTYPQLCSLKKKVWSLFWISFVRTNMMAM